MAGQSRHPLMMLVVVLISFPLLVLPFNDHDSPFSWATHLAAATLLVVYLIGQEIRNRQQLRAFMRFMDTLADWAIIIDSAGKVVHASDAMADLGYVMSEVHGKHWKAACPPGNHQMVQIWLDKVKPGTPGIFGPATVEMEVPGPSRRLVEVSVYRLDSGAGLYYVMTFRDITERRRMEEAMTRMDRLASIALLADGVAHNFNNIFGGIMLNTELLLHGEGAERQTFADRILTGAERGAELCRKLLTLARGEALSLRPVEVRPLVSDLVSLLETRPNPLGISVDLEIEEGLMVQADPNQLQQVLLNLLFNAREAAGVNGRIRIAGRCKENAVALTVSNSGSPIPPERLPLIFLPFFSTKTDSVQATGLGLAVSQRLTQDMGGQLDVSSGPGQPTTFTVTLSAPQTP